MALSLKNICHESFSSGYSTLTLFRNRSNQLLKESIDDEHIVKTIHNALNYVGLSSGDSHNSAGKNVIKNTIRRFKPVYDPEHRSVTLPNKEGRLTTVVDPSKIKSDVEKNDLRTQLAKEKEKNSLGNRISRTARTLATGLGVGAITGYGLSQRNKNKY